MDLLFICSFQLCYHYPYLLLSLPLTPFLYPLTLSSICTLSLCILRLLSLYPQFPLSFFLSILHLSNFSFLFSSSLHLAHLSSFMFLSPIFVSLSLPPYFPSSSHFLSFSIISPSLFLLFLKLSPFPPFLFSSSLRHFFHISLSLSHTTSIPCSTTFALVTKYIADCREGWSYNPATKKCYKIFLEPGPSQLRALASCFIENAYPLQLQDINEQNFITGKNFFYGLRLLEMFFYCGIASKTI